MSASLARGASGRRKAAALAPRDSPGAGRPSPLCHTIAQGRKAFALAPTRDLVSKSRRPRAARFQEGCGHVRQPCAGRFRETEGLLPCAARLPRAERPPLSRRALPGVVQACPPALREALPGDGRPSPLRRAIARGPEGRRPCAARLPGAGRPSPLRRALPGGLQVCPPALREALPGAERQPPLRRAIARGRKAVALAPCDCPGAGNRRPRAARFQEGCRHVRQPCARRFSGDGRPPPLRRAISWGRKARPRRKRRPCARASRRPGAAPAASVLRSSPPGTRLPAWEGRE